MSMQTYTVLQSIHKWDVRIFLKINHLEWIEQLSRAARPISRSADGWGYVLIPLLTYWLELKNALLFMLAVLLAFIAERSVYLCLKKSLKRPRPPAAIDGFKSVIVASDQFSFPSGHTSAAFMMVTLSLFYFGPVIGIAYLWATLVGCSRVALGVHFPSDIAAGATLGTSIALLVAEVVGL